LRAAPVWVSLGLAGARCVLEFISAFVPVNPSQPQLLRGGKSDCRTVFIRSLD
jgi:hypothetical protein